MTSELARMRGIGDELERFGPAPMLDIVLVNPNVSVSTATVFNGLESKSNPPMAGDMPDPFDTGDWIGWLSKQRNDLQRPALTAAPVIDDVLAALSAQDGCTLVRMSGSGATCFALFEGGDARDAAAKELRNAHPDWWVAATDEAPTYRGRRRNPQGPAASV
jgi:4-diphosphocytidyl-2-C-methyl-D-erythritol kinase